MVVIWRPDYKMISMCCIIAITNMPQILTNISVSTGETIPNKAKQYTIHTRRVRKSQVQILVIVAAFPCVDKLPSPNQAPRLVGHSTQAAQVGVSVGSARAVTAALSCALLKASVPEEHELVWNSHPWQGHEVTSLAALQRLGSPASS
ncbi:hypothetical protein U9M48_033986 [Paspalum notatum var. saurae]|uniref:Uncharacterized protein n=1 Tax=Paspalum notatum var. saurae TaxID=547442 RepID=A0AAQ3UCN6_PASNO